VGAAASKLFAASVGDMVVVLSRSPSHKHYSLADIEWMVLPR
jgi:hemolysin-activating ACP:hemolysin acyltransferase